jgi:hypothetical protein
MDQRIRIRIHPKMSWIRNTDFEDTELGWNISMPFIQLQVTHFVVVSSVPDP